MWLKREDRECTVNLGITAATWTWTDVDLTDPLDWPVPSFTQRTSVADRLSQSVPGPNPDYARPSIIKKYVFLYPTFFQSQKLRKLTESQTDALFPDQYQLKKNLLGRRDERKAKLLGTRSTTPGMPVSLFPFEILLASDGPVVTCRLISNLERRQATGRPLLKLGPFDLLINLLRGSEPRSATMW